jgi:putative endonuclease
MTAGTSYQVYVLQNPDGKFYIGLSEDVSIRLRQNNQGVSKWTWNRGPWSLVWTSEHMSLSDARRLENRLKRQKGGVGFQYLTGLSFAAESGS